MSIDASVIRVVSYLTLMDDQTSEDPFGIRKLPTPLQPVYSTPTPNAPIELYSGPLEFRHAGHSTAGEGTLRYEWIPDSGIRFQFITDSVKLLAAFFRGDANELVLPSGDKVDCIVTRLSDSTRGIINGVLNVGTGSRASEVLFHLVNCLHVNGQFVQTHGGTGALMGRIVLSGGGWLLTIDPVAEIQALREALRSSGGYAVTHVGSIRRTDGAEFGLSDADDVLHCLTHLLSFAHGMWVAPILAISRDASGQRIREQWGSRILSSHASHVSWFSDRDPDALPQLFPKFFERWTQPLWRETIQRTIWWYVASNEKAGGLDGAIVLVQVALELLAWVVYVEDGHVVSQKGFDDLNAADKIRLLAHWMKVSVGIPPELSALGTFAAAQRPKCEYGPWALTEVRNALVHPRNRKLLDDIESDVFYDTWRLGMWYLELAVLHACQYDGKYCNRLRARFAGQVEDVPWKPSA